MKFELSYIDKLAKLLNENGLSGVVLKDGEQVIELKKDNGTVITNAIPQQTVNQVVQEKTEEVKETPQEVKTSRKEMITISRNSKNYYKPTPFPYLQIYSALFFINLSR